MQTTNLKISNGTISLPKAFLDQLGLKDNRILQARIEGSNVIIRLGKGTKAPYRVYNDAEIDQFLKDDKLPNDFVKKIQTRLKSRK